MRLWYVLRAMTSVTGGVALLLGMAVTALPAGRHPLHTTFTELTYDTAARRVDLSMRVFADDLGAAVARRTHILTPPHNEISGAGSFAYLTAVLDLVDRAGHPLHLDWCGSHRSGAVVWLCLRASAPQGLGGLRIVNRSLFELFDDQINIVQAQYGGRQHTMLFTKGDAAKVLPPG